MKNPISQVIRAYNRLIDLKEKHEDEEVLSILVNAIASDMEDASGKKCSVYLRPALKLFGRITSHVTKNGKIWALYALLNAQQPSTSEEEAREIQFKSCQLLQKATMAHIQGSGWEKDLQLREKALTSAIAFGQGIFTFPIVFQSYFVLMDLF